MLASCKGAKLEGVAFRHPFYNRRSPVYLGEYVTLEQGTGVVHSAPAYGVEDFVSCRRYGMKDDQILTPVMGEGKYAASLELFGGLSIWDANGTPVTSFETDASGNFRIALPPGKYILRPQTSGPYPRASQQTVVVPPKTFAQVRIVYDSGIR